MSFNKKITLFQFFVFLFLTFFMLNNHSDAREHTVEMTAHRFVPSLIAIKKGDSIKFINKSNNLHNVVIEDLKIRTKFVKKNEFLVVKFEKYGTFNYYCQPHKAMGMKGVIKVE